MRSYFFHDSIPYAEMDQNIVALVLAVNQFNGIETIESCGGHAEGKAWKVLFKADRTDAGYLSTEFLAWLFNEDLPESGYQVRMNVKSAPPYLNFPGDTMAYVLEGKCEADEIASLILKVKQDCFVAQVAYPYAKE